MTEQEQKEMWANFLNEMHALFSKHSVVMLEADKKLSEANLDGFKQIYATLPNADLIEIIQSQHIKVNELYRVMTDRSETTMNILRDISQCKDFVAFEDLKKKARSILLAQDMVDRGKPVDEVLKTLNGGNKGSSTIIVRG